MNARRLEVPAVALPPSSLEIEGECLTIPKLLPPRSITRHYNRISKTHKKLVQRGKIKCSVSLSDSPEQLDNQEVSSLKNQSVVDLPLAPESPLPDFGHTGSVHWGAVGDFSGVSTPSETPQKHSVIVRNPGEITISDYLPDNQTSVIRRPVAPSPSLLQGVSELLKDINNSVVQSDSIFPDTFSPVTQHKSRQASDTNPHYLSEEKQNPRRFPFGIEAVSRHSDNMDQVFKDKALALKRLRRTLVREMNDLSEEDLSTSRITVLERDLDRIRDLRNQYQDGIEDFLDEYRDIINDPSVEQQWMNEVTDIGRLVKDHANRLRTKKEQLHPTVFFSEAEKKNIELQEKSLKLKEQSLQEKQKVIASQQQDKENESLIMTKTESNLFLGEISVLGDMLIDEDWLEVDDETVSNAMRNLSRWQNQMNVVERAYRQFENMALKYSFPASQKDSILVTYQDMKEKFENAKESVQKEDSDRGLFTLEPTRTDIIKYPSFSGLPSEDYLKFKETMEVRFRENKVKKKEQVSKLRECIKGAALARVPDGVKDIQEAFNRLNEAFGNPSKVMNYNLKALEDLGSMPSEKLPNGQLSYAKKIEWLLKLEVILGKIIDLSERSSKLAHEAFSSSTYRKLWARFPTQVLDKLVKVPGEDGVRMQGILDKIKEMRQHAQLMDDECGNANSSGKKKVDGAAGSKVSADLFFKEPQKYDDCRICLHISATVRNARNLFENHTSTYATGCPKFSESSMEARRSLVDKVKLCPQCFHPDVIFDKSHLQSCSFSKPKKKNKYSCTNSSCKVHMWICLTHKTDNKKYLDKFRTERSKCNQSVFNAAVRKVRRSEKKKSVEIVPVPEGEPLFLFHGAQGRNRPLNTFYDSGCSHAVFKSGVPGTELKGQLVSKGPFHIGGVGGLHTVAEDEWVVLMPRVDGRKQLVQGLTVPTITCDFPLIALGAAIADIRNDDPSNEVLQNCKVPPLAGGVVDILLGIKYNSIFPEPLHSLPNGLTIYKSKLSSYQNQYDCRIDGSHTSFKVLANLAGGANQILAHFVQGLESFRKWGSPSVKYIPLSETEQQMAYEFNIAETDMVELKHLNRTNQKTNLVIVIQYPVLIAALSSTAMSASVTSKKHSKSVSQV